MIFTGKLRWYVACDKFGVKSKPILQQQYYDTHERDYGDNGVVELHWMDVEIFEEKI